MRKAEFEVPSEVMAELEEVLDDLREQMEGED
jgi:hypothetical protein